MKSGYWMPPTEFWPMKVKVLAPLVGMISKPPLAASAKPV